MIQFVTESHSISFEACQTVAQITFEIEPGGVMYLIGANEDAHDYSSSN
jgi:ABC-type uncharacterized transport system ATPase subunit